MGWLGDLFRRGDREAASLAIDGAIQADMRPDVPQIAIETHLKENQVDILVCELLAAELHRRADTEIERGYVNLQALADWAGSMGMADAEAKRTLETVISDHFTRLLGEILDDNVVDPSEDARISAFMRMIGSSSLSPEAAKLIDEGRKLYHACTAALVAVEAPVLLKKGEFCIYAASAEAFEDRSRTVRVGYHGPSARIRIAKGVYYSAGSMAVSRQTEAYQHSFGVGVLCITNKRLLWISPQKSISTTLNNIVRYDTYSDGIRLFKGTGKPLLFIWTEEGRIPTVMATRAIEELRD